MQESKGRHWWGVMEGGGAHLGLSLPVSSFIRRRSFSWTSGHLCWWAPFSFAGVRFRSQALFSFMGGHLRWWVVIFAFVRGRSPSFVGVCLRSWMVVLLVWSCRLYGVVVRVRFACGSSSSWEVVPLVGCSIGVLVRCWWGVGGGGKLVCGGGELVGCGSRPLVCGRGGSSWLFVVV